MQKSEHIVRYTEKEIDERIARGERPEEIRNWLIARYGAWVSYRPPVEPLSWSG